MRITTSNKNILAYLSYRKGFIKNKYNTSFVSIDDYSQEELLKFEKNLHINEAKYEIFSDAKSMIENFTWSHDLSYNIPNSNLHQLRKRLDKFISETAGKTFIVYKDYKLSTQNSTLVKIEISFMSNIEHETTRLWWDSLFLNKLNKFLKNQYVSKKSTI